MTDYTAYLGFVSPATGPWQTTAASVVIEVTNDSNNLVKPLNMTHLTQNEAQCPVYSYKGTSQQVNKPFINYISGVSCQFWVLFSATQVCYPAVNTSPTFSYSLENASNLGSLDPMSFMSINPSTGIISISDQSQSSNFNYKVTVIASGIPNGFLVTQDYTLYDLRLYFAGLISATMLSGEKISQITTEYSNSSNPLIFGDTVFLNGTSLPTPPYFIKHNLTTKTLTVEPTSILHFGVHTLLFKVSDTAGYYYNHEIQINVMNRAPYFANNITNANYSTTFRNITTFVLPLRVSPDLGMPWVRVISDQNFVSIVSQGTDLLMRVYSNDFYDDINDITPHNVSLEVFIPNYPNTTKYWVNLKILNTPPKFDMPIADYDMGLYWNKNHKLPKVSDPDEGQVSVKWGIVPALEFIKFEPTSNTFTFNPMEVNMIGEYNIMVTLTDHHLGTYSEEFTLRVHRPPMFAVELKKFFSMKVGSLFEFELPLYETEDIELTHSSLPGFAFIDLFKYTFKPTAIPHLGLFLIKGKLQNYWGSLAFDFRIEVTNEPPSLAMSPKNLGILQDTIFNYALPAAIDPEDQPITIKMTEVGQRPLPSFITFNPITKECKIAPTKKTKLGISIIQVDVYDTMNYLKSYKFMIQVLENTFLNKEFSKSNQGNILEIKPSDNFQRYQAKLIIQQVTRDGRATLKLAAGKGMTGQLAIQVTNETFAIRLLREEQVRYEVTDINEDRGTVEIQLLFANPSNVSNKMVSYAKLQQILQFLINNLKL